MIDERELRIAREEAELAMSTYARLLFLWNTPDDEHTEFVLRELVEGAIEEHAPSAHGGSDQSGA